MLKIDDMKKEVARLRQRYKITLEEIIARAQSAQAKAEGGHAVSNHDAFNLSASCSELAALAGKLEQSENVVRWLTEEAK